LRRAPSDGFRDGWSAAIVNPAEQLEELADLRSRGLLTEEEFEQQRARVLEP
jgi:cytochrome c-type biogenesis protein CcmH/NrfG